MRVACTTHDRLVLVGDGDGVAVEGDATPSITEDAHGKKGARLEFGDKVGELGTRRKIRVGEVP